MFEETLHEYNDREMKTKKIARINAAACADVKD